MSRERVAGGGGEEGRVAGSASCTLRALGEQEGSQDGTSEAAGRDADQPCADLRK